MAMETKDYLPPGERHPEKAAPCQVSFVVGDRVSTGTSVHFNDVGILILCTQPARLNAKLQLALRFPGMRYPITASGEVVWTNIYGPADSLSPRGMGVKFVNLDRDTARLLVDLARNYESYTTSYSCYYT
jgi:hypothetical protein